jgi:hypothetical protein
MQVIIFFRRAGSCCGNRPLGGPRLPVHGCDSPNGRPPGSKKKRLRRDHAPRNKSSANPARKPTRRGIFRATASICRRTATCTRQPTPAEPLGSNEVYPGRIRDFPGRAFSGSAHLTATIEMPAKRPVQNAHRQWCCPVFIKGSRDAVAAEERRLHCPAARLPTGGIGSLFDMRPYLKKYIY